MKGWDTVCEVITIWHFERLASMQIVCAHSNFQHLFTNLDNDNLTFHTSDYIQQASLFLLCDKHILSKKLHQIRYLKKKHMQKLHLNQDMSGKYHYVFVVVLYFQNHNHQRGFLVQFSVIGEYVCQNQMSLIRKSDTLPWFI